MGWFQGHEIDLGDFFREVLTLALPVQPLCREDCRGLCPQLRRRPQRRIRATATSNERSRPSPRSKR